MQGSSVKKTIMKTATSSFKVEKFEKNRRISDCKTEGCRMSREFLDNIKHNIECQGP